MYRISKKDISFVVQGRVEEKTGEVLKSIRKFFPESEIILSTWDSYDITGLEILCDRVIQNQDKFGNYDCFVQKVAYQTKINNINREILTTKVGVAASTRSYVFKTRTDFIFESDRILQIYELLLDNFYEYDPKWKIFEDRILTFGTGNPHKMSLPYHLSDYISFGKRNDIKKLWDVPYMGEDIANYCSRNNLARAPWYFNFQYTCEQWLWLNNLRREKIKFRDIKIYYEIDDEIIRDSELSLLNNFYFIDISLTGIDNKFLWLYDGNYEYSLDDFYAMFIENFSQSRDKLKRNQYVIHKLNKLKTTKSKNKIHWVKKFLYKIKPIVWFYQHSRIAHNLLFLYRRLLKRNNTSEKNVQNGMENKIFSIDRFGRRKQVDFIDGVRINMGGRGNVVTILSRRMLINVEIDIDGDDNEVTIGTNAHYIKDLFVFMGNRYNNRSLHIGDNATIYGARIFVEEDGRSVKIGNDALISDEVLIENSDGHVILDHDGKVINQSKRDLVIGDHVWIGRRASVMKNVSIGSNSIVGAASVVTGKEFPENSIICGNPARVIKKVDGWSREMFNEYRSKS